MMMMMITKATYFETMTAIVDEVNSDKTKVPEEFFLVVFCLIALLPDSINKLIHNRCKLTCKLLGKTIEMPICVCKRTIGSLLLSYSPLYFVSTSQQMKTQLTTQ